MTDLDLTTRTEGEGETIDIPEGMKGFTPGQVLGERYQILEMLGRGGMGEVWHAFDLKLRVEVALKALRQEFFKSERRLELLRQEVRAAREVVSPNVCRIFDLIEVEGRELVSMEYVDGATLLGVLQERGPLELKDAQDIASQFLAGLEAIHKAGLIHRDIKPENIMLTRAGRVVVMDFGLARQEAEGGGTVSGTPAYMAPEQAAGQTLDARADVYAAGVVLAEMVSPEGIKSYESRQSVWEGVRSEPAKLPDSPWAQVIKKAVAKDREGRYHSAHTLTRALEDVTLRVEGAEDLHPYPGLASFTESDAEYFFGREAEVEQMWRKLDGPSRMLALVGPSGAGKSSFLRAGLVPTKRPGWACVICTPGNDPRASLRRAVISELEGDSEALRELAVGSDDASVSAITRWRRHHERALVIVDQFEELFTQNTGDEQRRFAGLLGRLVLEADVFVLLSMRDDFLIHCNRHEELRPLFSELTPLDPPTGAALRRALTQPALQCGYRFENDDLVDEMLSEVESERGALPLLAFAAARLWEKRDRETGLLTRQAYKDIGGVGGALARHAEATIDHIGSAHIPVVRELFRNLVTAEGTRAVREWDELLSIFSDSRSESPEEVLRQLIDARLLTSYEIREEDEAPTRRVEIIHESLLANWPRLVRWQTQDADAAQLRDQLRQAARTWDEHARTDDTLWTGSAYREFAVWRERYPGGLTGTEEAFAAAMTTLAGRRRRRRRMAVAAVLAIATAVAAVTTALWRRSVVQERRAEAQKLIAIGQVELEDHPTAALAHAIRSLELANSDEARFLAMKALWSGPTAFVVDESPTNHVSFSLDGKWLVQSRDLSSSLGVISRDGQIRVVSQPGQSTTLRIEADFGVMDDVFLSQGSRDGGKTARSGIWSASEGRLLASAPPIEGWDSEGWPVIDADSKRPRALFAKGRRNLVIIEALYVDGAHQRLGELRLRAPPGDHADYCLDQASGDWLAVVEHNVVSVVRVGERGLSDRQPLGRHEGDRIQCLADPRGRYFVTVSRSGEIKRWDPSGAREPMRARLPVRPVTSRPRLSRDGAFLFASTRRDNNTLEWSIVSVDESGFKLVRSLDVAGPEIVVFDPVARRIVMTGFSEQLPAPRLWSLEWPEGAQPLRFRRGPANRAMTPTFSPDGRWLAISERNGLSLWPLSRSYPVVLSLDSLRSWSNGVAFAPDGRFIAAAAGREVRVWPLGGPIPAPGFVGLRSEGASDLRDPAFSPDGDQIAACADGRPPANEVWIGGIGEDAQPLSSDDQLNYGTGYVTFSSDGRLVAAADGTWDKNNGAYHVWESATRTKVADLRLDGEELRHGLSFASDGRLLTSSTKGVSAWNVETGERELLVDAPVLRFVANADGRRLLLTEEGGGGIFQDPAGSPSFFDLDAGDVIVLTTHGGHVRSFALDPTGDMAVTGGSDGVIRVGPVTGEEPHLLLGHEEEVLSLAIDPTGRWIASCSMDKTVRLWPMPDLSKPPLHTLPREELIAKLKTLTNLRVVRDEESPTGWKVEIGPFPGWAEVPEW